MPPIIPDASMYPAGISNVLAGTGLRAIDVTSICALPSVVHTLSGKSPFSRIFRAHAGSPDPRPLIDGKRFEGFLGGQVTNLFDMTRRS